MEKLLYLIVQKKSHKCNCIKILHTNSQIARVTINPLIN